MPVQSNTDKINELGKISASPIQRVDTLKESVDRLEVSFAESVRVAHELDKRLSLGIRDVERLETRIDELRSRRWDLWKIVLGALLVSGLAIGSGFVARWLDRMTLTPPHQAAVVPSTPLPRK